MLVNCVAYKNGDKIADVPVERIAEYLQANDAFVWVAVREPSPAELQQLSAQFDLHPLAVEDADHGHQRPKIDEYGDSLFVVLHTLELVGGEMVRGEVAIFVGRNYVLSVRSRAQRGFADVRARCEREPELLRHGPPYVLYALMDAVVDRYFPVLEMLQTELEGIEDRIFSGQAGRDHIEALYDLKQKLMVLKHATSGLLDATGKLFGGRVPHIAAGLSDYFRDVYDHLTRLDQSIDSLREMVTTAISVNLSLLTIQESEVTKRLASYAALVAVPTMIAGIYGMNFSHMPELDWRYGYPMALAAMAVIDAYLFYRFRRAKWL
ncbi:MAG: magnesium/cobalt transporter CorA [Pseudomonadota bacterium]